MIVYRSLRLKVFNNRVLVSIRDHIALLQVNRAVLHTTCEYYKHMSVADCR